MTDRSGEHLPKLGILAKSPASLPTFPAGVPFLTFPLCHWPHLVDFLSIALYVVLDRVDRTHFFLSTRGCFVFKKKEEGRKKAKVYVIAQAGLLPPTLPVGALGTKGTFGPHQTIVLDIQISGSWKLGIPHPYVQPTCAWKSQVLSLH